MIWDVPKSHMINGTHLPTFDESPRNGAQFFIWNASKSQNFNVFFSAFLPLRADGRLSRSLRCAARSQRGQVFRLMLRCITLTLMWSAWETPAPGRCPSCLDPSTCLSHRWPSPSSHLSSPSVRTTVPLNIRNLLWFCGFIQYSVDRNWLWFAFDLFCSSVLIINLQHFLSFVIWTHVFQVSWRVSLRSRSHAPSCVCVWGFSLSITCSGVCRGCRVALLWWSCFCVEPCSPWRSYTSTYFRWDLTP